MKTLSVMWLTILCGFVEAEAIAYSGGQGTLAQPYVLSSREDILELASRPEDIDKSFILTEDIDLEGHVFEQPIVAPDTVLIPSFGEYQHLFTGCFNGNGHVIENFSIIGERFLGFFGAIGHGGRVMHLGLKNMYVDGASASNVGMLAGASMGDIIGCFAQGQVVGYSSVGGLVGYQLDGHLLDCFSRGDVDGTAGGIGGLVGILWQGTVERCYTVSIVNSENPLGRGGLVGMSLIGGRGSPSHVVLNSFWDIDVSGVSTSNGGLGSSTGMMHDASTYLEAGWDFTQERSNGINDMWTRSDSDDYPLLSSFSGMRPVVLAGEGNKGNPYVMSSARELAVMVYYNDGRHFVLGADIDLSAIEWSIPVVAEFDGHLDGRGYCVRGFRQDGSCGLFGVIRSGATVSNLRLEESEVEAGDGFAGCLAGENRGRVAGCSVTGIIMGGAVTGGLVGCNKGDISECVFSGAAEGFGVAGGLAGENADAIINSVSRGAVSGDDNVGGLVGDNSGSVRSCYSTAVVVGYSRLGGLVGLNSGNVADCYARGAVIGACRIGGLIGQNNRSVLRSYSTGSAIGLHDLGGLIGCDETAGGEGTLNSFWDIESSGILRSAGGTGLNTGQMQDSNTFVSAGWDFAGETVNGTQGIWVMPDNSYPELTLSLDSTPPPVRR